MKAYCRDGVVLATHDDDQDVPASRYGEGVTIVPVSSSVEKGDALPDPDEADLLAYARTKRASVLAGGCVVTVDGLAMSVWADTQSQTALSGLVLAAQANPTLTTHWKGRDGTFYEINAADAAALAAGVMAFVQAAFAVEAAVTLDIGDGTITTRDEIDAADWPANG